MVNLVVQTAFLGDLLLSIPLLRRMKQRYPRHHLSLLCRKGLGDLFLQLNLVDEVFEMDKKNHNDQKDLFTSLKKIEFDYIICPHESVRSAWIVSRLQARHKVGFYHWWNFWAFNERRKRPMHLPDALRQLSLMISLDDDLAKQWQTLSKEDFNAHRMQTNLPTIPHWASMSLRQNLIQGMPLPDQQRGERNIIYMAPGSVWATKRWTEEGYIAIGRQWYRQGYEICLLGSSDEHELCEKISQSIPRSRNLAGQLSLLDSLKMMCFGRAIVCNDSGAMHLASCAELPSICIFGPTVLDFGYRPWQDQAVVVQSDLSCRPCGKHGARSCPIGTHECMTSIGTDSVSNALHNLLKTPQIRG